MSWDSVVYDESADWIVEQAHQQGIAVTRRQLGNWHRAGLISKPDREFLGGPDGSVSIYPRGTLRQAIECSSLMKRLGSVEQVGWELWMRGFPVAESLWREPLREAHEMLQLLLSTATDPGDNEEDDAPSQSEEGDRLIETLGERAETPRRLGVARRRLRRDGYKEFLSIVISAAIGAFRISDAEGTESGDPAHVLSRLAGTEPGRHKASIPSSPLLQVTGQAIAENLEAMAEFLPHIPSSISPDTIAESELASARDEVRFLVNAYLSVRQNEARIVPGSTPDIELLKQLLGNLGPRDQAAWLLIWLGVRQIPGWRDNLLSLCQAVTAALSEGKIAGGMHANPQDF